jgi:hypothetical protein
MVSADCQVEPISLSKISQTHTMQGVHVLCRIHREVLPWYAIIAHSSHFSSHVCQYSKKIIKKSKIQIHSCHWPDRSFSALTLFHARPWRCVASSTYQNQLMASTMLHSSKTSPYTSLMTKYVENAAFVENITLHFLDDQIPWKFHWHQPTNPLGVLETSNQWP